MLTPLRKKALNVYALVREAFEGLVQEITELREELTRGATADMGELADVAYAMNQAETVAREVATRCASASELAQRAAAIISTTVAGGEPARGEWATGTPDVSTKITIPSAKSDPNAYREMMLWLGADAQTIDAGVLRPHWPALCEHVNMCVAAGQTPRGIHPDKITTTFVLRLRAAVDQPLQTASAPVSKSTLRSRLRRLRAAARDAVAALKVGRLERPAASLQKVLDATETGQ